MHTQIADAAQSLDMRPLTDAEMGAVKGGILNFVLTLLAFEVGALAGLMITHRIINGRW